MWKRGVYGRQLHAALASRCSCWEQCPQLLWTIVPPRCCVPLFEGKWGAASLSVLVFLLPLEGAARVSSWLSVGCAGGLLLAQLLWKLCGSLWKCGSHRSRDRDRSRGRGCGCCCEMAAAPGMDNATKALGANLAQSVGARRHPQDGAKAEPPLYCSTLGGAPQPPAVPQHPPALSPRCPPAPAPCRERPLGGAVRPRAAGPGGCAAP